MFIIILVCINLIIILLIYIFSKKKDIHSTDNISDFEIIHPRYKNNFKGIPKVIWSYWHNLNKVPNIVTKCIDTWIIHNPDYIINILDDKSFNKITGIDLNSIFSITNNKSHQKRSDFIRLSVLSLYGGIWMDASIICMHSLNWISDIKNNCEFIGYIAPNTEHNSVIDSWFLASIYKSTFIKDWLQEFKHSLSFKDENTYCNKYINKYPVPEVLKELLPYLTIHLSNWIIRYRSPNKYNLYILSSTSIGSPLYYSVKNNFNYKYLHEDFKNNRQLVDMNLFKIVSTIRDALIIFKLEKINTNNKYINYVFNN